LGRIRSKSFICFANNKLVQSSSEVILMTFLMTLQDIIEDIHALNEDLEVYERKYGVLSETFYEIYQSGQEPDDEAWVLDWSDWAGAYKILLRRQEQYHRTIETLRKQTPSLADIIGRTSRRESIPVPS
jgi:hypothetical protein